MLNDEFFMERAIELSKSAVTCGNEPFGAVLVKNGEIVYCAENKIYTESDPTYHAEAGLIREFCHKTGVTDLSEYTLYSSCEPCFMCSGAIVRAKLKRLVFGASNKDLSNILGKKSCYSSQIVFENSSFKPQVTGGVLKEKAIEVLKGYFGKNH